MSQGGRGHKGPLRLFVDGLGIMTRREAATLIAEAFPDSSATNRWQVLRTRAWVQEPAALLASHVQEAGSPESAPTNTARSQTATDPPSTLALASTASSARAAAVPLASNVAGEMSELQSKRRRFDPGFRTIEDALERLVQDVPAKATELSEAERAAQAAGFDLGVQVTKAELLRRGLLNLPVRPNGAAAVTVPPDGFCLAYCALAAECVTAFEATSRSRLGFLEIKKEEQHWKGLAQAFMRQVAARATAAGKDPVALGLEGNDMPAAEAFRFIAEKIGG